jgi:uncharacterized protein with GYD domain
MAQYIITGSYTAAAIKGMLANPSDREAAARGIIESMGGKVHSFLLTTGDSDFSMIVETGDAQGLLAGLIVVGGSGAVSGLKTVQAFTSAEFLDAQKRAKTAVAAYSPPA